MYLTDNDIHIWYANLDQPIWLIQQLSHSLSQDEKIRAKHFHFEIHHRYFIVGRGILRSILAGYLNVHPSKLQFNYGENGKPSLAGFETQHIQFNLSHSHKLALYAFTKNRHIGIDLEYIHPIADLMQVAKSNFSSGEYVTLQSLPINKKLEGFFNCWTRKEAYIKAIGAGLSHPLHQFDVSLRPGEPARLLRVAGDPQEPDRWSLYNLRPASGYVSALAVEGTGWRLVRQQWPGDDNNVEGERL